MARKFKVNGKTYIAKPFDFNTMCDLEDMNVNIEDINNKPMRFVREYFALCSGLTPIDAGNEIQKHMIDGGTVEGIANAMRLEIEKSDFFQSLAKKVDSKIAEIQAMNQEEQ